MASDIIPFPVERIKKTKTEKYVIVGDDEITQDPVYQTILDLLNETGDGDVQTGRSNDQIAKDIFRRFDLARKTRDWIQERENTDSSDKPE